MTMTTDTRSVIGSAGPSRLSHWFPIARRVLPEWRYPKTEIVSCDAELVQLLDGQEPPGFQGLIADLELAALRVGGYPCFLRHDLCSAKHDWRDTCFVAEAGQLPSHVAASVEYWHSVNWFANDIYAWAVREYVPVSPVALTAFRGMPVGPERRYCVRNGEVIDHFPYWPLDALWRPTPESWSLLEGEEPPPPQFPPEELLQKLGSISAESPEEVAELSEVASVVGAALGGEWSIDFMHTARGWLLIDCAVLSESWIATDRDRAQWAEAIAASGRHAAQSARSAS